MKIDKTDQEILNLLISNSKLSYRKIAKQTKKSVATIMNRIKRLEKEGVIKKYTINVNYEKLGYDFPVIIEARVTKGKTPEISKKVSSNPYIVSIHNITGNFDVSINAKFKTREQLNEFVKNLLNEDYVGKTNTRLVLETLKEDNIKLI